MVGREEEIRILQNTVNDATEGEFITVFGRRRVGKTFLIRQTLESSIRFEITGIKDSSKKEQLQNFHIKLVEYFGETAGKKPPRTWLIAMQQLITCLNADKLKYKKNQVVFFDELPWLATEKSGFLNALGFLYNSWATKANAVIVVCGSAASWMIKNIINNKGGLHNRTTIRINLMPFTLYETEKYLQSKNINLEKSQVLELYMAMGGIPFYLKQIQKGISATENVQNLCFKKNGLLFAEFNILFDSLFENATNHINIIRSLAKKSKGLTRQEIIASTGIPDGGNLTRYLQELNYSGFIQDVTTFNDLKKNKLYKLYDEYSLFYLKFIEPYSSFDNQYWLGMRASQSYKSWSGYAFENICHKHVTQIKNALQISGLFTKISTYVIKGSDTKNGAQIDMIIDRNDNTINVFEIKYYNEPYFISKKDADQMRTRVALFRAETGTKKQIFISYITNHGIIKGKYSIGFVDKELTSEVLFNK